MHGPRKGEASFRCESMAEASRLCSQATAKKDGQFTQDLAPLAGVPDLAFNRSSTGRRGNYYAESVVAAKLEMWMHGSWDRALTRAPTAPQTCHFICASFAPPGTGTPLAQYQDTLDGCAIYSPGRHEVIEQPLFKQR
jgi:hypothetical protein